MKLLCLNDVNLVDLHVGPWEGGKGNREKEGGRDRCQESLGILWFVATCFIHSLKLEIITTFSLREQWVINLVSK